MKPLTMVISQKYYRFHPEPVAPHTNQPIPSTLFHWLTGNPTVNDIQDSKKECRVLDLGQVCNLEKFESEKKAP